MLFSRSAKSRTNVHEARPLNLRFLYPKTDKAMHGEGYPDGATPNDYPGARLHERDARRLGAGWTGDGGTTGNAGGAAADPGYLVRDHRRQPGGACWDDAGRSYLAQSSVTVARKRRRLRFARSSASRRSSFARWRHRRLQWRALSRCFGRRTGRTSASVVVAASAAGDARLHGAYRRDHLRSRPYPFSANSGSRPGADTVLT
jgi:hypothetical protein